ncbi:MAG: type II toxin-antitoxin system Phd/YefM family antitoxin [bacterium]|nr:type II toxin-antitoxin system Phd/YefM family antitoxin [bacterium]
MELPETISATEARQNLFALLDGVSSSNKSYTLTKDGKPVAKLVNIEEWKGLLTTLEIMANPDHQKELDEAIKEVEDGKTSSFEEVFGHLQPNFRSQKPDISKQRSSVC